ncbi:MAG: S49 family peptidase [Hafnia alvei]|uniref:S49 family peptidase n=1 Tax=Hafnia alvei TaxID=569 RepID=UPI003F9B33E8
MQTRNLPHIASLAFNEPLLLEPAYARVFFCALGQEIGAGRLIDSSGAVIESAQMPEVTAGYLGSSSIGTDRGYDVQQGIAQLSVSGTLVSKAGSLRPYSGMTGYNGLITRIEMAIADPDVKGILLDMDTPGGMVAGAFDAADMIARFREHKPIWALANDMHCSAGQLIASACSHRLITQTARVGSIGVIMAHSNYAGQLEQAGIEITLIYSGNHKVDGNPYQKLPDAVREDFQRRIDATRLQFAQKVSEHSGLSLQAVMKTEAQVFTGQEAIDVGLSDALVINADALNLMADTLNTKIYPTGGRMSQKANATTIEVVAQTTNDVVPAVSSASATLTTEQLNAAVTAERERMTGILGCTEAKGREGLAAELANTPGMSVADAQRLLASASISAQARTDTALDTMMASAPQTLGTGSAAALSDADDLDNIPV